MHRIRLLTVLSAATVLALPLCLPAPRLGATRRAAAPEPDYTITVDPAARPEINDSMYGVFFEDINFAADGGLYAELVRNRSFEFLPVDNRSYTGLTAWTPAATAAAPAPPRRSTTTPGSTSATAPTCSSR